MRAVNGIAFGEKQREMSNRLREIDCRLWVLFELGTASGYRISDLLRLKVKNVLESVLEVLEQKTGKQRRIELTKEVQEIIKGYVEGNGLKAWHFLFPRNFEDGLTAITRQWVYKEFKRAASDIGLCDIGTHTMRKTYAFNLLLRTRDFGRVQDSLNHRYMSTTLLYLLDSIRETLPPMGERIKSSDYKSSDKD